MRAQRHLERVPASHRQPGSTGQLVLRYAGVWVHNDLLFTTLDVDQVPEGTEAWRLFPSLVGPRTARIRIDGPSAAQGHQMTWTLLDSRGREVAKGQGLEVPVGRWTPGRHVLVVHDGLRARALDLVVVVANLISSSWNRLALFLAQTVLVLAALSVFGWAVKHRTKGDRDFGVANKPLEMLAGFPDLFKQSVKEAQTFRKRSSPPLRIGRRSTGWTKTCGRCPPIPTRRWPDHQLWNLRNSDVGHRWVVLRRGSHETALAHPPPPAAGGPICGVLHHQPSPLFRLDSASRWFGGKTA